MPPDAPSAGKTLSYARVSTRDQLDGYSLDAQRERLAAYAGFNDLPAPLHFEDPAISGRRDVRPAFSALMAALKPGDTVLAKDLTRIARGGIVQTLTIIREIEARGARLILIDQSLDTSTPFGRVVLSILATFAEFELEQTRERSLSGRTQAARTGSWPQGSVPYGYRRDADKRLELNPDTKDLAYTALMSLAGRSYEAAALYLQAQGHPAPGGGTRWSASHLHRMGTQTAYIGQAIYTSDGEPITVPCPRLVTDEEWQTLHAGREAFTGGLRRPDTYPLVGHLRCAHGAPWNGRADDHRGGGMVHRYHVSSRLKHQYGCDCPSVRAEHLDTQAREVLARVLTDPSDPAALRAIVPTPDPLEDQHALEREEIKAALSNLARLRVMGQIEERDYLQLREELKTRERALAPVVRPVIAPAAQLELAADVRASTPEQLAELLDLLEVRWVVSPPGVLELVGFRPI
ncbi:recombinase family protein [Deinococcus yunweiensis]|uniref:recombinase family protein n=1 Tax=Deinococcus yunweiensis TaxID=367282 RepID=UPI00398E6355